MKNKLLQLIEEEINKALNDIENGMLFEQAPPADPAASPPADPAAAGGEGESSDSAGAEEEKDEVTEKIKALAKKTTTDIKKTLVSDMQDGDRENAEKIIATVEENGDNKEVTSDLKNAVKQIQRVFNFKVSDEVKDEIKKKTEETKKKEEEEKKAEAPAAGTSPAAPAAPAAPVTESKLQTLLREYLVYKQLYEKEARK